MDVERETFFMPCIKFNVDHVEIGAWIALQLYEVSMRRHDESTERRDKERRNRDRAIRAGRCSLPSPLKRLLLHAFRLMDSRGDRPNPEGAIALLRRTPCVNQCSVAMSAFLQRGRLLLNLEDNARCMRAHEALQTGVLHEPRALRLLDFYH